MLFKKKGANRKLNLEKVFNTNIFISLNKKYRFIATFCHYWAFYAPESSGGGVSDTLWEGGFPFGKNKNSRDKGYFN